MYSTAPPRAAAPPSTGDDRGGIPGRPSVTIEEVASFFVERPRQSMEPDGWAIVGLDANFIAAASRHTRSAMLLGAPAEVRFTPVRYDWSYGDGATRQAHGPGATWTTLQLSEFSPTSTSHAYGSPGTFTVALTVRYSAEYRYAGGPWQPVPGELSAPANDLVVSVLSAQTVLVDEHCGTNPTGPGC
ncbi:PKD domain-containing protein [Ruicaihuangia caeni]|uniref:PKD domain-containing protein n=1 Tax=Ruicaihuangia caeni TaxID=3042517 RepID=UPI003F490613